MVFLMFSQCEAVLGDILDRVTTIAPFLSFGAAVSIVMDRLFPGGLPA